MSPDPQTELEDDVIGSPLAAIPTLNYVESQFSIVGSVLWMRRNWYYSFVYSAIYLVLLFQGRKWMSSRKGYHLRQPLFLWNVSLAIFSFIGGLSVVPNLVDRIVTKGFVNSCCRTDALRDPHIGIWALLFAMSKVLELGDTLFIVLRKGNLAFLHWYHHITVFVYTWYGLAYASAIGHWFSSMNLTVHTVMYSYYAVKALGYNVPSKVALAITVMQISQMFSGMLVTFTAWNAKQQGLPCEIQPGVVYFGWVIYGSYAILFLNFFYQRYVRPKTTKKDQ